MAPVFTVASEENLLSMIRQATERLIIVAPGLSAALAQSLVERMQMADCPEQLSITLDIDPEVCRLGYGSVEAFDLLHPVLASRGVPLQTQRGIRIGLLVSDSDVLVYSPTPQIIESVPGSQDSPNAIHIATNNIEDLSAACGSGVVPTASSAQKQEIGLSSAEAPEINAAKADLKLNPPRKFDLTRLERVFNYKLEFVEFSLEHYQLNTRSVPLPPELLGLADEGLRKRLRNTFKVFEAGSPFQFEIQDPENKEIKFKVDEKWFRDQANKLRDDFLIPLGSSSYGNLIFKRHKAEFLKRKDRIATVMEFYAKAVRSSMEEKLTETRRDLVDALWPRIKASPPESWVRWTVDGSMDDTAKKSRLEDEVDGAFRKADLEFSPTVVCLFKGVNYETITADQRFRKGIEKHFREKSLGEEELQKLFSEFDASPVQDQITI